MASHSRMARLKVSLGPRTIPSQSQIGEVKTKSIAVHFDMIAQSVSPSDQKINRSEGS
jgi:hypothetical protein